MYEIYLHDSLFVGNFKCASMRDVNIALNLLLLLNDRKVCKYNMFLLNTQCHRSF